MADETFLQTALLGSPFARTSTPRGGPALLAHNLRYIDWPHGRAPTPRGTLLAARGPLLSPFPDPPRKVRRPGPLLALCRTGARALASAATSPQTSRGSRRG